MSDNDLIKYGDVREKVASAIEVLNNLGLAWEIYSPLWDAIDAIRDIPAVSQEMSAREYLREFVRMCNANMNADGRLCRAECPMFNVIKGAVYRCKYWGYYHPDEAVAIVEKWAKEHP